MVSTEVSPRVALGLAAAERGDVRGVEQFMRFIRRECVQLDISFDLPLSVRERVSALGREAERVADYAEGYAAKADPSAS